MGQVTQDFKFNTFSGIYGRFLVECETNGIAVESAQSHHKYEANFQFVTIECPEHIAMLMKLAFGGHLVERPPKVDHDELKKLYDEMSKAKSSTIRILEEEKKEFFKIKYIKERNRSDEDIKFDLDMKNWLKADFDNDPWKSNF